MADWRDEYDPRRRWELAQAARASQAAVSPETAPIIVPEDMMTDPGPEPELATTPEQQALADINAGVAPLAEGVAAEQRVRQRRETQGVAPGDVAAEDIAAGNASTGAQLYGQALEQAQKKVVSTSLRPGYEANKKANERMSQLVPEQEEIAQRQQAAQMQSAQVATDFLQQEADMQQQLHAEILGRQAAQAARAHDVQRNIDNAHMVVQKATENALKVDDIDPDRAWGEKGVGAKVLAVIASAMLGWAGMDPFAHINSVIENSLNAQKYNRDQARAKVGQAQALKDSALSSYDALRAQLQDEQLADEAYRIRSLLVIQAQAKAKLAKAGVTELSEDQDAFMNGLQQQITERMRVYDLMTERNTPTVTTVRPALTGQAAALNLAAGKKGLEMMATGAESAVTQTGARQTQGRALQADIAKEQRAAGRKETAQQRYETSTAYKLRSDTVVMQGVLDSIADWKKNYSTELPAFGSLPLGVWRWTDKQKNAYYDTVRIITRSMRPETGAAYTKQEIDNASAGIINENMPQEDQRALQYAVDTLKGATEEQVYHVIDSIETEQRRSIKHLQAGIPEHILEQSGYDTEGSITPRKREQVDEPDPVEVEE